MVCASYLLAHLCEFNDTNQCCDRILTWIRNCPSVEISVTTWNEGFDEARATAVSLGINSVENGGKVPKEFWEKPWIGEIDDAAEMRNEEMKN